MAKPAALMKSKSARARDAGQLLRSRSGRTTVVKVRVAGSDRERVGKFAEPEKPSRAPRADSNAANQEEVQALFERAGVLEPVYDPRALCELYEDTAILRPNVDAYCTNIDGHGHHFKPMLDVKGDDAFDKVFDAMVLDRMLKQDSGIVTGDLEPSDKEVESEIDKLTRVMRIEHFRLQSFFAACVIGESFVSLRRRTRQDIEVTGNGYWEVLRRQNSPQVAQFVYLHSYTMRLLPMGEDSVPIEIPIRVGPLDWGTETVNHRFRRFVQITDMRRVTYFKEYGDPRVMSARTGKFYSKSAEDMETGLKAMETEEPGARAATEVLHFKINALTGPYGVPRWIGARLAVQGTAKVDEVNYLYFDNKAVPPLALLVTGGKLGSNAVEKIENFIEDELKGAENFHKVLVIEAESPRGMDGVPDGRLKIELKPLTDAQQKEGLFMRYEERNTDRVGMMFRVPRLLRGDVRDFNRATSESALKFTESQVFGPERNDFDHIMNAMILPSLGIRYWSFVSNAVQITNPEDMSKVIAELAKAGVLWPSLAIELLSEYVFNRELPIPDAAWAEQPVILTQTGLRSGEQTGASASSEDTSAESQPTAARESRSPAEKALRRSRAKYGPERTRALRRFASDLMKMSQEMERAEAEGAKEEFLEGKVEEEQDDGRAPPSGADVKVIKMPVHEMIKKLGVVPDGDGKPRRRRRMSA